MSATSWAIETPKRERGLSLLKVRENSGVLLVRRLAAVLITAWLAWPAYPACVGKQRWAVKTTADAEASKIKRRAIDTTIAQLVRLPRPSPLTRKQPRTKGVEETVYVLDAVLVTFFSEKDQDRHLVLRSRGSYLVAEIADPRCVSSSARFHDEIHAVRDAFDEHFKTPNGKVRKSKKVVNERVRVTGVGFFDAPHKVTHAAPNFIELHPVIKIEFLNE